MPTFIHRLLASPNMHVDALMLFKLFLLRNDGCVTTEQTFPQQIKLEDHYLPEFDVFPDDVTLGVFDAYGTDATGFPTAFQRCGNSPVDIAYSDNIVSTTGDADCSSGFTIIARTFTAADACQRTVSRTQTIRIGNEDAPMGAKGLSLAYAGEQLTIDMVNETSCLLDSLTNCGISGAPTDTTCGSAEGNEFSDYQDFLEDQRQEDLGEGSLRMSCSCRIGDRNCQRQVDRDEVVLFGSQQVIGAPQTKMCSETESTTDSPNQGTITTVNKDCPNSSPGICTYSELLGTNPVYNTFELDAADLGSNTISIDVPATSFVLINIATGKDNADVTISPNNHGVILTAEGLDPSRILWNAPEGVNLMTSSSSSRSGPYSFQGTLLNRFGTFHFDANGQDAEFQGQLFANTIIVDGMDFICGGHFIGLFPQSCTTSTSGTGTNSKSTPKQPIVRRGDHDFGF